VGYTSNVRRFPMIESSGFPAPKPGDSDEVQLALETASALWSKGDAREALRWLRRAAETAGDAGDDLRAVGLARAAADLSAELQIPPSIPPPGMSRPIAARPAIAPTDDSGEVAEKTVPGMSSAMEPSPAPTAAIHGGRPRQALRVSVLPSDAEKGLLLVRVLGEGEHPPPGAHEALLVAVEAGAHLQSKRR
jgi:hypothetical protein